MPINPSDLVETHSVGSRTIERRIMRDRCPQLFEHGIGVAGISDASDEFRFVRHNPHFTQVLVCVSGLGVAFVDGEWVEVKPGWAYVTPPSRLHAYHTAPEPGSWKVAWVLLPRVSPSPLAVIPDKPRMVETDAELFHAATRGLFLESAGKSDPAMLESWTSLLRALAARVAGAPPRDEMIDLLWRKVAGQLAQHWTLGQLAGTLGCSEEHLRRLCQRRYGCSPSKRLLSLRMQHAASLLNFSRLTIAAIAEQVGYENEFAFSTAFKRWSHGVPPSIHRRQAMTAHGAA